MSHKPSVIVIGSGVSGLCAVIKLRKELDLDVITVFEAESGLGGTWLVNTYPGCACDVPSHLYSFSFELNPNWTTHYASQPEILAYLQKVAEKYDVLKHIRFNTTVVASEWVEEKKQWKVTVQHKDSTTQEEFWSDILISGAGPLRIPKMPEEFKNFKGPVFHTARWDSSVDLTGKKVALVGSGASSIQAVPAIADKVEKLWVYQRTPSWIVPRRNFAYPEWAKTIFRTFPITASIWRSAIFLMNEFSFYSFGRGSWFTEKMAGVAQRLATKHLSSSIPEDKKTLVDQLTPKYSMGCKRILVSNDYYPAMARDNVELITEPITKVTAKGIQTSKGENYPDVLIAATGFHVEKFLSPMRVTGRRGLDFTPDHFNLDSAIESYLGINMNGFPNAFFLLGPNTGLGHNSVIFMIECQMDYIVKAIRTMMENNLVAIEPKEESQQKFAKELQVELKKTVFTSGCDAWYSNSKGEIYTLWGGNCISYYNLTKNFNLSDYHVDVREQ